MYYYNWYYSINIKMEDGSAMYYKNIVIKLRTTKSFRIVDGLPRASMFSSEVKEKHMMKR